MALFSPVHLHCWTVTTSSIATQTVKTSLFAFMGHRLFHHGIHKTMINMNLGFNANTFQIHRSDQVACQMLARVWRSMQVTGSKWSYEYTPNRINVLEGVIMSPVPIEVIQALTPPRWVQLHAAQLASNLVTSIHHKH